MPHSTALVLNIDMPNKDIIDAHWLYRLFSIWPFALDLRRVILTRVPLIVTIKLPLCTLKKLELWIHLKV